MSESLYNPEVEAAFLGAVADVSRIDPFAALEHVQREAIHPEDLWLPEHKSVFLACLNLLGALSPAEPVAVWGSLKADSAVTKAGGFPWLLKILSDGANEHLIPTYGQTIRDLSLRRRMRSIANELNRAALDERASPAKMLKLADESLAKLVRNTGSLRTNRQYLQDEVLNALDDAQRSDRPPIIQTGLPSLDALIGGLQKTLIVLGGPPGSGKSAFLATIADKMTDAGHRIGVFSLEDTGDWIAWRLLARETRINQFKLRYHKKDSAELVAIREGAKRLAEYGDNMIINDATGLTAPDIAQSARQMIVQQKCEAIIFDHLGEVAYENRSQQRHDLDIKDSLRTLRDVSKDFHIPVVVACHPKRRDGLDKGEMIGLQDFADSAAIERMARVALGLCRPQPDTMRIKVLKQTNGEKDVWIDLPFSRTYGLVSDDGTSPIRRDE